MEAEIAGSAGFESQRPHPQNQWVRLPRLTTLLGELVVVSDGVTRARISSAFELGNGKWPPLVPNGSVDTITIAGSAQEGQKKSY